MAKSWREVRAEKLTPERDQKIRERVEVELRAIASLRELRKAAGLTQEALAEFMNVSQPELSRVENSANPTIATLRKFVEALGGELEIRARLPEGVTMELEFSTER